MFPDEPAFHGYAPPSAGRGFRPPLAIVISRETGARGRSIAERVAEMLGWDYLDQESLEYLTQGEPAGTDGGRELEASAASWVEERLQQMMTDGTLARNPDVTSLVRRILEVSTSNHCVVLARGAGRAIPPDARLHVKLVAPLDRRVALIAQIRRLSPQEAKQFVQEKDESRESFLAAKLGVDSSDLSQFDMVLNTSQFGVEASAKLIAQAAREKDAYLEVSGAPARTWVDSTG